MIKLEIFCKFLLFVIYFLTSLISIIFLYKKIRKNKKIEIIDFFNIYYIIVYFLVPIFSIFNNSVKFTTKYADFFSYDLKYHILSYFMALIFYLILNYTYKIVKISHRKSNEVNINNKTFMIINIIFSIIGIVSYYLWSKIYGFPFGILKYADVLRDNNVVIDNPYTIFQPICNFTVFASYMWLILIKNYNNKINKIIAFLLFCLTFFFSILSTFATDSRMSIITLFLVPIIYFVNKRKINVKKIIVWGIVSIILLGNLDNITYFIRNNAFKSNNNNNNNNVFVLLSNEFGFTYSNRINLIYNIENKDVKYTELQDIKNTIFAWVPKSMRSADHITLGEYNTKLYSNPSGTIPTDVVSASIYKGRFFGLILLPIFIGILLKYFDVFFESKSNDFHKMMFYIVGIILMLRFVAYYDLSDILFGKFALIIYYFVVYFLCREKESNENF